MEGSGLLGGFQYPPGFRFHPTDQELIIHYLSKKVNGTLSPATSIIADVDLYKFSPWDLPRNFFFGEGEWFFFSPRDRKYPNGARPNRAAGSGYWKATGTDKPILTSGGIQCLGVKKALVFYKGRPPKGIKTDWVMQEYRLLDGSTSSSQKHKGTMRLDDWVLCRVRQKSCVPAMEEEKKTERSKLSHVVTLQQAEKNVLIREREAMQPWTDHQLLAYLTNSAGSEEESECEIPQPGSAKSSSNAGTAGGLEMSPFGVQQQHEVSAMINSIKRNLSFGALDEVIMRLPSIKRLNYSSSVDEQMSSSGSFSADESYLS